MRYTMSIPGLTMFPAMGGQPDWARDITPDQMQEISVRCEQRGFSHLLIPWHIAMPRDDYGTNMGARWPHSLAVAGFILGATRSILVAPLVVSPCHNTIEMAKAFATLDWMSGSRCLPVILAGYARWEFDLLGADYEHRNEITDEQIEAMQLLWGSESPRYDGTYVQVPDLLFEPKPRGRGMPLWIGGKAKKALRRVAKYGQGWMSYASPAATIPAAVDYIRSQPGGERTADIFCYFNDPTHDPVSHAEVKPPETPVGDAAIIDRAHHLAECKINVTTTPLASYAERGQLKPARSYEEFLDRLDWFGQAIIPATRHLGETAVG